MYFNDCLNIFQQEKSGNPHKYWIFHNIPFFCFFSPIYKISPAAIIKQCLYKDTVNFYEKMIQSNILFFIMKEILHTNIKPMKGGEIYGRIFKRI